MTKLAFYNHTGEISGAEVVLLAILRGVDRTRFVPVAVSPPGGLSAACALAGVPHVPVREIEARFTGNPFKLLQYGFGVLRAILSLRRTLGMRRPQIVHSNGVRAGLIASLATIGLGMDVIWHIHDMLPDNALSMLIRRIADMSPNTSLIAVSHATAVGFRGNGLGRLRKPITVIYNGVDFERFRPDANARERVRRELGLADRHVAVGVIGQITPRKGQLDLVRAFAQVRHRMPEVVLVIVGTAQFNEANRRYERSLAEFIAQEDLRSQVWLAGKREDIAGVVNAVDLLAQNSLNEPLGLALMEGFAAGKTAAATAVDGVIELIEDGLTGLLAQSGDSADLVRKIEVLVNAPALRRELGLRACQKMKANFSLGSQMSQIQKIYDQLAAHCVDVTTVAMDA